MSNYTVPANLKVALQSPAGQEALEVMFAERLRVLQADLAKADDPNDLFRLQGHIREVRAMRASLIAR